MNILGTFHTAITVRDMEESLEFYVGILGMNPTTETVMSGPDMEAIVKLKDVQMRMVWLEAGTAQIELLHYITPPGKKLEFTDNDIPVSHLCLEVEDAMEAYEYLKSRGVEIVAAPEPMFGPPPPLDGYLSFHILDPNGYNLEIKQRNLLKKPQSN